MRILHYLVPLLLICGTLAIAGCTSAPATTPAATKAPAVSLPSLAIDRADLPDGYVLTMSREKNISDMSSLAKTLGWQAGYVAEYTRSGPAGSQCVVLHSLATYPESSMPDVVEYVNKTDHSYSNIIYTDIPVSGVGTNSRGFIGGVRNNGLVTVSTPSGASPALSAGEALVEKTPQGTYGQNFVEVVFSKGTTFEVIRMSCTAIDEKGTIAIAQKAYQKIS